MSELEAMLELAYLYGVHSKEIQQAEDLSEFIEIIEAHAANLPIWFARYSDTSPLQVLHDYFLKEVLGK